jgi:microcin C transport system permease protein
MNNIFSYWLSLFPVLALSLVLLLIAFVGEGVRQAFDPKEYQRME